MIDQQQQCTDQISPHRRCQHSPARSFLHGLIITYVHIHKYMCRSPVRCLTGPRQRGCVTVYEAYLPRLHAGGLTPPRDAGGAGGGDAGAAVLAAGGAAPAACVAVGPLLSAGRGRLNGCGARGLSTAGASCGCKPGMQGDNASGCPRGSLDVL